MSANWKNIGPVANIPRRGARRLCLKSAGKPVAVFRTGDGDVFALIDECPHKQGPLSEGIVAGNTVTCPLHNWVIGLEDGEAVAPDNGSARTLSLRIVDGDIFIHLPELVAGDQV
ncbi:MAG: nitrite reductase (NAD(P)H) small subunit [Alphaproteobacteria bacterium]|jgi:nitrite reductase (NADH) small subunit|nr:nitrite reductase (NAD(P)H) small subunit [Alphaproteobacteria bacterium]